MANSTFAGRLQQLQQRIKEAGAREMFPKLKGELQTVGQMVIKALDDTNHPFTQAVQELEALQDGWDKQHPGGPPTLLFASKPGTSIKVQARLWREALLLFVAAQSKSAASLCAQLKRGQPEVKRAVAGLSQQATDLASPAGVHRLIDALEVLKCDNAALPFSIKGNELICDNGRNIKLARLELAALNCLLKKHPEAATAADFKRHGVVDPRGRICAIKKKLGRFDVGIRAIRGGGYTIAPTDI